MAMYLLLATAQAANACLIDIDRIGLAAVPRSYTGLPSLIPWFNTPAGLRRSGIDYAYAPSLADGTTAGSGLYPGWGMAPGPPKRTGKPEACTGTGCLPIAAGSGPAPTRQVLPQTEPEPGVIRSSLGGDEPQPEREGLSWIRY